MDEQIWGRLNGLRFLKTCYPNSISKFIFEAVNLAVKSTFLTDVKILSEKKSLELEEPSHV